MSTVLTQKALSAGELLGRDNKVLSSYVTRGVGHRCLQVIAHIWENHLYRLGIVLAEDTREVNETMNPKANYVTLERGS